MKLRTSLLTLAFCLAAVMCFAANDAFMGTWKLNEAKSKIGAGSPKNHTVTYEAAGDDVKVTIDGTAADGTAMHSEGRESSMAKIIRRREIPTKICARPSK